MQTDSGSHCLKQTSIVTKVAVYKNFPLADILVMDVEPAKSHAFTH